MLHELRVLGTASAIDHVFSGFQYLGVIGHRDPVRHLRPRRGDGQCGERGSRWRFLSDDARAHRRRRRQPDRLPDGQPFINAVYIGHPGWKAMGGRIGYSAATGIMVIILSWSRHLADARDHTGRGDFRSFIYRHADRRAGVPKHADPTRPRSSSLAPDLPLCKTLMDAHWPPPAPRLRRSAWPSSPGSACFTRDSVLGGGAILAEPLLGAIAAFVIDKDHEASLSPSLGPCSPSSASCMANRRLRGDTDGRVAYVIVAAFSGVERCAGERTRPLGFARGDPEGLCDAADKQDGPAARIRLEEGLSAAASVARAKRARESRSRGGSRDPGNFGERLRGIEMIPSMSTEPAPSIGDHA